MLMSPYLRFLFFPTSEMVIIGLVGVEQNFIILHENNELLLPAGSWIAVNVSLIIILKAQKGRNYFFF